MRARSFDLHRSSSRIVSGFVVLVAPALLMGACSPTEREYTTAGAGGASSSSTTASSGGGEGTSTSSSSSSGNPVIPGEILSSQFFPNATALLFDLAVDPTGNSLLTGRFSDVIDFGDGPLVDVGGGDIFLARHDRDDKLIFSKSYGGVGNAGIVHGTVSPQGTMFVTGDISDMTTMSFGGNTLQGPGVWHVALGALGSPVIFDYMINHGMNSYLSPYGVVANISNASVFVGIYNGTLNLNPMPLTSLGDTDGYMIKFNPAGKALWVRSIGGVGHDNVSAIAIDTEDNNYAAGYFTDSMMIGQIGSVTSVGGSDIFVIKSGPGGTPKWVRTLGGIGKEFIFGTMAVAPNGDVVVASGASEKISVESMVLPAAGGSDIFIARYSTDGVLIWAKRYGDIGNQFVDSLAVDSNGNILVTGLFDGTIDFGSGALTAPAGGGGAYLAKLDPGGVPIFTRVIGGQLGSLRLAADGILSVLLAGTGSNVSFSVGTSSLPNGGLFLARIAP